MRLLSRALLTFALLGGLGFGSYAFGKYVLSSRLFGNKGSNLNQNFGETVAAPAARSSGGKGAQTATASVEILPEGAGGNSSRPAPARNSVPDTVIDRSNTSGDDGSTRIGTGDGIEAPLSNATPRRSRSSASAQTSTREERARPRRKRRRARPTAAPQTQTTREEPAREAYSNQPDVVVSDEGGDPAPEPDTSPARRAERIEPRRETPREVAPSNDTPSEARPRRRRRMPVQVEERAPRERVRERVRIEPRRETPRQESPVPVPESGGDSPVPIPE